MMGKRKLTKADLEARAESKRNGERLLDLAEKALADLERKRGGPVRPEGASNSEWLRQLAEKAQAELDARKKLAS
jgi:hypothetical protein